MAKDQIDHANGVAAGDVAAVNKKQEVASLLKKMKVEEEVAAGLGGAEQSESAFDPAAPAQEVAATEGAFAAEGSYEVAQAGTTAGSAGAGAGSAVGGGMSTGTMLALGGVALVAGGVAISSSSSSGGGNDAPVDPNGPYNDKFSLTVSSPTVSEGSFGTKEVSVVLTLSSNPARPITVNYQTNPGTASSDTDFVSETGTVTFAAGQSSATVTITVRGDSVVEANEAFTVSFAGGNLWAPAEATVTIANDDVTSPGPGVSGALFTLQEVVVPGAPAIPPETRIYWGYTPDSDGDNEGNGDSDDNNEGTNSGVPVEEMVNFLKTITGLDLAELGLIDDDGVGPFDNVTSLNISNALSLSLDDNDLGDDDQPVITINYNDGSSAQFTVEAQIAQEYFSFLNNLLFDGEGNSRLYEVEIPGTGSPGYDSSLAAIRLTPNENNGGTIEQNLNTTALDDLIIAGRVELLHQAYIDGGAGRNVLEIDAKGTYAQPTALLNIQEVRVNDLPNFYTVDELNEEGNLGNTEIDSNGFPIPYGAGADDTWIDLNRALQLDRLVVSDQGNADSEFNTSGEGETSFDSYSGDLTIVGVRNAATLRLEGGFRSGDTTIQYGFGQTGVLDVELAVGTVDAAINILQNASVLRIDSQGVENNLQEFFMGGNISRMIVTGDAILAIEGDLGGSFNANRPAVIDASANTAGVDLNILGDVREVRFLSSEGEDDVNFFLGDSALGITKITVDGQDGDGHYDLVANAVYVDLGNGDNVIHAGELFDDEGEADSRTMDTAVITVGNGRNTIDAIAFVAGESAPNPSPDANVNEDTQSSIVITAGNGGNDINAWGDFVTVNTGTGNDEINATGREITINSNGGNDVVTLFGNNSDFEGSSDTILIGAEAIEDIEDGVLLNINLGTGNNTLVLGAEIFDSIVQPVGSVTALTGSVITGSNITLVVNETSDLREASLTGITRVLLDNNNVGSPNAVQLTITADQFSAIGAAAFDVDFAAFGAAAQIKIIITEDTTLSDLVTLADLSPNVRLNFEIYNDATLTLTAEELHTYVAPDGITVGIGFNGNVVINNAGPNFDPFQETAGGLSVGSLADTSDFDDVVVNRVPGGFERPNPDEPVDQLVITNTDLVNPLVVGPIDLSEQDTDLILNGGGAFTFTTPILLSPNFLFDFSEAGAVNNLTIGNFHFITEGELDGEGDPNGLPDVSESDLWGEIIGNGLPGQRINIHVGADVGDPDDVNNGGFVSTGVDVYVVTNLYDAFGNNTTGPFNWDIATCVNTEVETLGLQGNYEDSIDYLNVERGIDFLLEVAYDKEFGYAVGDLGAHFARPGGDAVFNVVNIDAPMEAGEVQRLAGIDVENAVSLTINVTGGNTVLESLDVQGATSDDFATLVVTADANLNLKLDPDGDEVDFLPNQLSSFDGSGVVGVLTVAIDNPLGEDGNGPLVFVGAAGSTELNIDDAAVGTIASIDGVGPVNLTIGNELTPDVVDLTETLLGNIGTVALNDDTTLSVTLDQADAIGPANFLFLGDVEAGDTATLNLVGLNDQVFSVAQYPEGFIITVTLAEIPEVFINPLTDFTGIDSLFIPEGTTLYLSMEQYQQLGVDGMGDDVVLTGLGSVVITGTTQASVGVNGEDLNLNTTAINLTGVDDDGNDISTVTVNLVEDVNLSAADMALSDLTTGPVGSGTIPPSVDVFNIGTFTLTLGDINTADTTQVIGGVGSTLKFTDITEPPLSIIDAGGFDVDFLEVEAALVGDNNVDFMFDNLIERVTKVIVDEFGQVVGRIQNVVIEATTTVVGDIAFNDYGLDSEVTTLNLTLGGGALLNGDLIVSTVTPDPDLIATYLEELNIISEGTEANTINGETDNVITGNVTPLSPFPGFDPDGPGGEFGEAADNQLKVVNITATQNLVIGDGDPEASDAETGSIIFSSHGEDGPDNPPAGGEPDDGITANDDDEADVNLNILAGSTADVTIEELDISDEDVENLFIDHDGTGTLTVTGGTPAIVTGLGSEGIYITGTGDIVLSDELALTDNTTLESTTVSVFDASGHSGLLAAGEIQGVDNADFSFTSGSGVTSMKFTDNNLDSTAGTPGTADDTAGWSFDFSNAAVGSTFHFAPPAEAFVPGSKLSIDMGPNAVLFIDTTMDLSDLDLTLLGGQAIVLADGAVLTLTAEQADGLTIIAGPDGDGDPDTNGTVNIVNLNEDPVDLSGISEDVAGVATLELDPITVPPQPVGSADVTLDELTDLGFFGIQLISLNAADDVLSGQTIRFTTAEQAGGDNQSGREITLTGPGNDGGVNSTNVVWLFENLPGEPINTSGYFEAGPGGYQIGRLWIIEELISNEGGDIEDLFTTLPTAIIRAEFSSADLLDALLNAQPVDRIFEVVSFLNLGDINFSDAGLVPDEFIESLTIKLGGQSDIDDIILDDAIAPNTDPDSVVFDTLNIESHRSLSSDYFLSTEFYNNDNNGTIVLGENVPPAALNTIDDISTGNGLELLNVGINTLNSSIPLVGIGSVAGLNPGAAIEVGTITYDSDDVSGADAVFTGAGDNDITVKSQDTTDASFIGGSYVENLGGFSGTYTITGGSPAYDTVAESITLNTGDDAQLTVANADTVNDSEGDDETITITYLLNGVANSVQVAAGFDPTSEAAVAAAIATALSTIGDATLTTDDDVVASDNGVDTVSVDDQPDGFQILSVLIGGETDGLDVDIDSAGSGYVNAGTAVDAGLGANYAGVDGNGLLSEITINGEATVNLGTLVRIDGSDDDLVTDAFTLTGNGDTSATLGQASANGALRTSTLEAGSTWTITGTDLTVTSDVIFQGDPGETTTLSVTGESLTLTDGVGVDNDLTDITIALDGVEVIIEGNVDLTDATLVFINGTTIEVEAGNTLVLTVQQALALTGAGVHIFGEGTTEIIGDGTNLDLVGGDFRSNLDTVNIDISAVTLNLPTDGDDLFFINVGSAQDDAGDPAGHNVTGSANDDNIDGGQEDDTLTGGAGDDTLIGQNGSDTFNVDAGTDTIADLVGEDGLDPEQDVLVVSAGAEALATTVGFIATADTVNNGTATITGADGAPVTIDVSLAGGANGFILVGNANDESTLIGGAQDDVINSGDGPQALRDVLTGNGGDDHFVFDVIISEPATFASVIDTPGEDEEVITITAGATDEADEVINVNYQLNNVIGSVIVDLTAIDSSDDNAVAAAIAAALDGVVGMSATANMADVTVVADQVGGTGNFVELTNITDATPGGATDIPSFVEAVTSDDNDVPQVSTVTLDFGGGTATAGETYTLIVSLRNGTDIIANQFTAVGGETEEQVAAAIVANFNAVDGGTNVLATDNLDGSIELMVDPAGQEDATGGFEVDLSTEAAFGGSGASEGTAEGVDISVDGLAAVDPDYITDFTSGEDQIAIGELDSGDYDEENTAAASFDAAAAMAEAAFAGDPGTNIYLTFVENQDDPTTMAVEADVTIGYLFFDVTDDDVADGVIALVGIDNTNFAAGDIEPYFA